MLILERVIGIIIALVVLASQYGSLPASENYKQIDEKLMGTLIFPKKLGQI